jgi:TonB family protein
LTGEVVALGPGDARRREIRRLLAVSSFGHLVLLALLAWSPGIQIAQPPGVISVNLVSMPGSRAPVPARARPRVVAPKKVVLPMESSRPASKLVERAPERPSEAPAPPEQKDLSDVLADLRAEKGEEMPEPVETATASPVASAVAPGATGGSGARIDPELAAWMRRAKIHIRRVWVVPPGFRTQVLETHVVIDLDAAGRVVGEPRITRRSGNPWYDEGVMRAIRKASPLPAPPAADAWAFVFVPEDSY